MTSRDRAAARHGRPCRLTRLALGLGGDTRAGWTRHGVLMLVETSGLAAAIGGSAVPAELVADLDPPRSQLPSLAFSAVVDRSVSAVWLMTSPSPSLAAGVGLPKRIPLSPASWPPLPSGTESLLVSGLLLPEHCRPLDEWIVCPQEHRCRL